MSIQSLAADIAARVPAMGQDSPLNNAALIERLIKTEMHELIDEQRRAAQYETYTNARHAEMVAKLVKPGADIIATLTPEKADLWHMGTGVAGEAGELLDAIKKVVAYNKPTDRENVVEELGDLEFFMQGVRRNLGITREETLESNMKKLGVRYEGHKYSDEQAALRRDKQ